MGSDGRPRRSLLRACGAVAGVGLVGTVARLSPSDDAATGASPARRDPVGLLVYNADGTDHTARIRVLSNDGPELSDRRALPPSEAAAFRNAIPVRNAPAEYAVEVRLASGATARETIVLDPSRDVREVHAVIRDGDAVELSVVTAANH